MLRRVALVRTNVSEELSSSIIKGTRIGELGTTLPSTSNRRTLRRNFFCLKYYLRNIAFRSTDSAQMICGLFDIGEIVKELLSSICQN
jgi:hypothetical protein